MVDNSYGNLLSKDTTRDNNKKHNIITEFPLGKLKCNKSLNSLIINIKLNQVNSNTSDELTDKLRSMFCNNNNITLKENESDIRDLNNTFLHDVHNVAKIILLNSINTSKTSVIHKCNLSNNE